MATSTFNLYTIDIDVNKVIDTYKALCTEGEKKIEPTSINVFGGNEVKYIQIRKPRKALNDATKIKNKVKYIIHTIAYRQFTHKEESEIGVSLKASILQATIGEDYYEILKALEKLNYIEVSHTYVIGKTSKHYKIKTQITSEECKNFTILKYIVKSKQLIKDEIIKRMTTKEFIALYGNNFAETYIKNLNKFKIKDEKGFVAYTTNQIKQNPTKETYYNHIRESFKNNLKIYSIDNNNRIYHILTSLERELKQFINIKFSIDCKNSHPLLFNYFIFHSKGITTNVSYKISSILINRRNKIIINNSNKHHYDIEKLRNLLIDSGIGNHIITKFYDDELLYICKTTNGEFWDDILKEHENDGYNRAEIKQKMFAEVFYSKTPRIAWKKFAKEFNKQYPNVYALIMKWKEPLKHNSIKEYLIRTNKAIQLENSVFTENQETALPNVMMALEASIFREVLKSLYRKRINAVHIHDAIVVPFTKAKVEPIQIDEVMREIYKQYGLHPTFSLDTY